MDGLSPVAKDALPTTIKLQIPGPDGQLAEVRRFSNEALQARLDALTATLPDDKTNLVFSVGKGIDDDSITAMFAVKTRDHWSVATGFSANLKGQWTGQLEVRKAF